MYRSEVEALRERVRTLERDLQEERAKSAMLQQRLHNVLHPPPPPPPPVLPELNVLIKRAWYAAVPTYVCMLVLVLLTIIIRVTDGSPFWLGLFLWPALSLFVTVPLGIHFANQPIKARTEYDSTALTFITWFWLPFSVFFPLLGALIALYRAYGLIRGRFDAFTITENDVKTTHYEATQLRNEGYPAASLFACVALMHPLLALLGPYL